MAEYRQKMKLPLSHSKNQPTNCSRVPGVLLYVLLHCCTAVCSKGLVGGWVGGALRRPWWVGGPFRTWESFFVLWEMNFFFVSKIPASHWCLGVHPSPLLHSSVLYYRTYYCFRVIIFVLQNLHTGDDTFTTVRTAALSYCPVIFLLFFGYFSTEYRGYSTNLFLSAIPAGNWHISGVPLVT